MTTLLADVSQQAAADAVVDRIDTGSTNSAGRLRVYDDSEAAPSSANDSVPAGSVLLLEADLQNPAYGSADLSGVAELEGVPVTSTAVGSGVASWFRIVDRDEGTVLQGDARAESDSDNGEELVLDNTNIATGQTVNITSLDYTHPAAES